MSYFLPHCAHAMNGFLCVCVCVRIEQNNHRDHIATVPVAHFKLRLVFLFRAGVVGLIALEQSPRLPVPVNKVLVT